MSRYKLTRTWGRALIRTIRGSVDVASPTFGSVTIAGAIFLGALLPALAGGQTQTADDAAFEVEGFEEEGFEEVPEFAGGEFPEVEIATDAEDVVPIGDEPYTLGGWLQAWMDISPREPDPDYGFNRKQAGIAQVSARLNLFLETSLSERAQARLGLDAEVSELFKQRSPPLYPSNIRDKEVRRLEADETYVDWRPTNKLWLRLGNQINTWGTSDNYRVVDVLNPRDLRLFEQEGPEETRLPNWASRISYTQGGWSADLVGIFFFRGDRVAGAGGDFDPFILFRSDASAVTEDKGADDYTPEWALRVSRNFHSADFNLYAGDVYNKVAVSRFWYFDPQFGRIVFAPDYDRMTFFGLSGSYVRGSWLFKTDMAYKQDLSFLRGDFFAAFNPVNPPENLLEKDVLEAMFGVEYNGLPNSSVSLELVGRHIFDYEPRLVDSETTLGGVLTFMNDALKDTLHTEIRAIRLFNDAGYIINAKVEYDLTDDLDLTAIYTEYLSTDSNGFLHPYRDNDRLLLGVTYRF